MNTTLLKQEQDRMQKEINLLARVVVALVAGPELENRDWILLQKLQEKTNETT